MPVLGDDPVALLLAHLKRHELDTPESVLALQALPLAPTLNIPYLESVLALQALPLAPTLNIPYPESVHALQAHPLTLTLFPNPRPNP